jgi:hypothetical protein
MSDAPSPTHSVTFGDKVRVAAVCGLAMALFASVGWTVARPSDPEAAVSLLLESRAWPAVLVSAIALAAVASAVATAVVGPVMAEAGSSAAAVGLAMLSTRGGTMTDVLMYHGASASARRVLAPTLIAETLMWFAAIVAAWLVGGIVRNWLNGQAGAGEKPGGPQGRWARVHEAFVHLRDGLLGMIVCAVIAWVFISATISRSPESEIQRGQVFFSVGAGFLVAAAVGKQLWIKGAACWYALSVVIVAGLGYGWATLSPLASGVSDYYAKLATTPPNDLFRALPIEYVGVGVAGAILGHWMGQRMHESRVAKGTET